MNSSSNRYIWVLLTLFALSVLQSCNPSTEEKDSIFPATWQGEWTGVQPDYPMRDAQGNVIYIRGQEALVKSSTFVFSIQEGGNIQLTQSIDDGRVMEFQGRWNAIPSMMQMDSKTKSDHAFGIRCELTAASGAYRNFILRADTIKRVIECIGTRREPLFELIPS